MNTEPRKWCLWHLLDALGQQVGDVWIEVGTEYTDRRNIAQSHGAFKLVLSSAKAKDGDGAFCNTCYHDHLNIQSE